MVAVGMKHKVGEDGAWQGTIRMSMSPVAPKLPPMHSKGPNKGGDSRAIAAFVHASAEEAGTRLQGLSSKHRWREQPDDGGKKPDISWRRSVGGWSAKQVR